MVARVIFLVSAALLLYPSAVAVNMVGVALLVGVVAFEWRKHRSPNP
jgi:hypothetical protein